MTSVSLKSLGMFEGIFFKGLKAHLKAAAVEAAKRSIGIAQFMVLTAPPANPSGKGFGAVDTKKFLNSWSVQRHPKGAVLYNRMKYADVIDYGRKKNAAMPPPDALRGWVGRKLGITKRSQARSIAFLIARAIKRRGLNPRYVKRRAMPAMEAELERQVQIFVSKGLHEATRAAR